MPGMLAHMRTECVWVCEARSDKDDQETREESKAGGDLHTNQLEDPRALGGWPV
jgi:hypothetical protein